MPRIILNFDKLYCGTFLRLAALAVLLTGCFLTTSLAQQPGQKTFSSPEDASSALVAATQSNDEKAMLDILGPEGKQIVSSGDNAEDTQSRANFVEKYGEMHRLVKEPDGTTVRPEDQRSCRNDERIQPQCQLARGGRSAGRDRGHAEDPRLTA
jgi:hypothetical protein